MSLCKRLSFETLEPRWLLAKDLQILSVQLTNVYGDVTVPVTGEKVYARVNYQTTDLTTGDTFNIRWTMDGVAIEESIVGSAGMNVGRTSVQGGWIAHEGPHTLSVMVDGNNTVAESSEANNSISFQFTPDTPDLPQKFLWPVAGTQNVDWVIEGYVDTDPRPEFEDYADYQGRGATYNGHNGIDIALPHFAAMDAGVPVLAAAAGTVSFVTDGDYDRWLSPPDPYPEGNIVTIDHGNGWRTHYLHMRRDSIDVAVGEVVTAGQQIGLVGSSGYSLRPHLHLEVTHNNSPVEPFTAPSDYFVTPPPYTFDAPTKLLDFGIANVPPTFQEIAEHVSDIDSFPQTANPIFFQAWAIFASFEAGDTWEVQLFRPNGTLYSDFAPVVVGADRAWDWSYWFGDLPANPASGDWRADWIVNGAVVAQDFYNVSTTARPEIRVYREDGLNYFGTLVDEHIIDGRTTPIDFGTVDFGDAAPTKTFTVENHGYANLTTTAVLPVGYTFVEPLSSTIAAGASDTFTVQLLTNSVGAKAGEIFIFTNDTSEATFNFMVEGLVDGNDADFDNDGDVDGRDFLAWQRGYGITTDADKADGDATGEGAVNGSDLAIWQTQYGTPPSLVAMVEAEGEPSAEFLLGLELFADEESVDEALIEDLAINETTAADQALVEFQPRLSPEVFRVKTVASERDAVDGTLDDLFAAFDNLL